MKKNSLKVALNMSSLSVQDKINKATRIVQAIQLNSAVFATPAPPLLQIGGAISALESALLKAADGGKTLTALMRDKEAEVMTLMLQLAHYVEALANGDEEIVHLAGMEVKQSIIQHVAEFRSLPTPNSGEVKLKIKARKGSLYKWQYLKDPAPAGAGWVNALMTNVSTATIGGLAAGVYLFRVVFLDGEGEHEGAAIRVAVS